MKSSLPFSGGQVHFKFKSTKAFDSVSFDGHFVSVKELRALIAEKKASAHHCCTVLMCRVCSCEPIGLLPGACFRFSGTCC